MFNNPISMSDPEGDLPFLAVGIQAVVSVFNNGLSNISQGQGFFDGAGKAALWGAIEGAESSGIGDAANSLFGQGDSFGKAFFQFGAHGLSNGLQSHLQGGSFSQGLLSGGISSIVGSTLSGAGAGAQILGSGIGGGAGSVIGGGNFFSGFGQGIAVGAFNHAAHVGASAIEANIHVKAARAFMEDLGYSPSQVKNDVVRHSNGFFGRYYAELIHPDRYIGNWTSQIDSRGGKGFISPSLKGYNLKFYPGRLNSLGLNRSGAMHYIEAGMELIDGKIRENTTTLGMLWRGAGVLHNSHPGFDNTIYDMHGRNSRGYLNIR